MGTKYCPEAPRQKMISLMYLVLTAMLALNVDKSVLEAFVMVNQNFIETIENFTAKNNGVYKQFSDAELINPVKVKEFKMKALNVKAKSDSLYQYILSVKEEIVIKADGPGGRSDSIISKDNLYSSAEVMMTNKRGIELKNKIISYRNYLLALVDTSNTELIASIKKSLDTTTPRPKDGSTPSWESTKFEGYPLIAVISFLSKMQNDVRSVESDVIKNLFARIDIGDIKVNKLQAQVVAKSDYVLQGDTYEAKVFLSAVDTTAYPSIFVGGSLIQFDRKENAGFYKASAQREGKNEWSGYINYKLPDGSIGKFDFKEDYEVARPSMTVSPTRMNVFYYGIDNPVSISVPSVSASSVKPSITNGTIQAGTDGYIVRPDKVGVESIITVSTLIDGTSKEIGKVKFRVKKVPDPVASVGGKVDGAIAKNDLLAQQGILAKIPDFDFEMKFTVLSFNISTTRGGFVKDAPTKGNRFSQEQKDLLNGLNPGSRLYIESIEVKGEDNITRTLPTISLKITN